MKKIGLCVRYNCNNYGSMLQIFATQKALEKIGCNYEIIRYDKRALSSIILQLPSLLDYMFIKDTIRRIQNKKNAAKQPDIVEGINLRHQRFAEYRKQYIGPYSPAQRGYLQLKKHAKKYDSVVVGSDQLWNPAGLASNFYNLIFVPEEVNKVSFATSFGVAAIPKKQIKKTRYYLNRLDYISVREETGKEIVKSLTAKDASIVMDPTLMFSGSDWKCFFPERKVVDKPYIFAYLLGMNSEHRIMINEFAQKEGLIIVTCPNLDHVDEDNTDFGDLQLYDVDPVDFLNLIRGAEYVFTDSFHGTVFSILNHKQFLTFYRFADDARQSTNTRIDNLLNITELTDRKIVNSNSFTTEKCKNKVNYALVEETLSKWRKESFIFLREALIRE